jgi:hypothetical protein
MRQSNRSARLWGAKRRDLSPRVEVIDAVIARIKAENTLDGLGAPGPEQAREARQRVQAW